MLKSNWHNACPGDYIINNGCHPEPVERLAKMHCKAFRQAQCDSSDQNLIYYIALKKNINN